MILVAQKSFPTLFCEHFFDVIKHKSYEDVSWVGENDPEGWCAANTLRIIICYMTTYQQLGVPKKANKGVQKYTDVTKRNATHNKHKAQRAEEVLRSENMKDVRLCKQT